jgi:hypothetical protein
VPPSDLSVTPCTRSSTRPFTGWHPTQPRTGPRAHPRPPQTRQSGRHNARARTGKGNRYLKSALAQIATGAAKTDTFLGQRYRRLIKRMPKAKALVALQRSILVIFFHLLADPTAEFTDLGSDFYAKRIDRARRAGGDGAARVYSALN